MMLVNAAFPACLQNSTCKVLVFVFSENNIIPKVYKTDFTSFLKIISGSDSFSSHVKGKYMP